MNNSSQEIISQIDVLIRSRHPIVYITTWEEERVISSLKKLVKSYKQKRNLYIWSSSKGFTLDGSGSSDESMDLNKTLDHIIKQDEAALYILKDIQHYFDDHKIVRKIKDAYYISRKSYKNIIIISSQFKIPEELTKVLTLIDFPLPSLEELEKKLEEIISTIKSNPNIKINMTPSTREQFLKAALGLTLNEAENVFAKALVKDNMLTDEDIKEVLFEKQQTIKKTGVLEYCEVTENLSEIGGLEFLKEWLSKRGNAFTFKAKEFGLPSPKGVMLLGVQGCGKSLCAKAMASIWQMPLLRLDVGRVFSSYMGSSEENIRTVIKLSESVAPCILWIDEVEKAFAGVKSSGMTDGGTTSRVFGTFITWLQEKKSPVFVIATANDISQLPPEFLRKGRFDEIFFVDLPNTLERENIFKIHLKKFKREHITSNNNDIKILARKSEGFSGAEIEQAVITSLFDAFDSNTDLQIGHLLKGIDNTIPLSKTMSEEIEELRNWAKYRTRPASSQLDPNYDKRSVKDLLT